MRVGIIGAGPAGTVCALTLMRGAEARGLHFDVFLFDGKPFQKTGPRGCNMCAGVISSTLLDQLAALGAKIPPTLVQRYITGHYFETIAGGVHIPKDPNSTLCTVFRGAGPRGDPPATDQSFDYLLLRTVLDAGVQHIHAYVQGVGMPATPDAPFRLRATDGNTYEVDGVVGAFGVNSAMTEHFAQLGFGYTGPQTYHVSQAEVPVDAEFLERTFHNEVKIFSLGLPGIHFGALTPKQHHVTVTIIGPHLTPDDLQRFLQHPRVRRHFPPDWQPPALYCHCSPRLPVTAARNAVADRLLIIGDAHIARYLKGGIDSAFFTGGLAAEMILAGRLTRRELEEGYVRPCRARYFRDNAYGRFLFTCNDVISRNRWLAWAGKWLITREQQRPNWEHRRHTKILWHIFVGDASYRAIVAEAFSIASISRSLLAMFLSALRLLTGRVDTD